MWQKTGAAKWTLKCKTIEAKLIGWWFTVQLDYVPIRTEKAVCFVKWNILQWLSQSQDRLIERALQLLKMELMAESRTNKQQLKAAMIQAWWRIVREETNSLAVSTCSRLQEVIVSTGSWAQKIRFTGPATFEPLCTKNLLNLTVCSSEGRGVFVICTHWRF